MRSRHTVILETLTPTAAEFERATGWEITPEGACKGEVCVPLGGLEPEADGSIDPTAVADRLGMPIAHDDTHGLWALGPRSGDRRALETAQMPELVLPDFAGNDFDLASLRGRRVVLIAWASW